MATSTNYKDPSRRGWKSPGDHGTNRQRNIQKAHSKGSSPGAGRKLKKKENREVLAGGMKGPVYTEKVPGNY